MSTNYKILFVEKKDSYWYGILEKRETSGILWWKETIISTFEVESTAGIIWYVWDTPYEISYKPSRKLENVVDLIERKKLKYWGDPNEPLKFIEPPKRKSTAQKPTTF